MLSPSRRFYRTVAVAAVDASYRVILDNRLVRTPAGSVLAVPGAVLAEAIAAEWQAQGERIVPETMPLTRLAFTALDRVRQQRAAVIESLLVYAGSDALCYRAESPQELRAIQETTWQPLLDWAAERFGASLAVTVGVVPLRQSTAAVAALAGAVNDCDDLALTGLANVVQTAGSLVIGLAVLHHRIDAEAAFRAAFLDECYQADRWGNDPEAAMRRERLAADIAAATLFLQLSCRNGSAG